MKKLLVFLFLLGALQGVAQDHIVFGNSAPFVERWQKPINEIELGLEVGGFTYWPNRFGSSHHFYDTYIWGLGGSYACKDKFGWIIQGAPGVIESLLSSNRASSKYQDERYNDLAEKYNHALDVIRNLSAHSFRVNPEDVRSVQLNGNITPMEGMVEYNPAPYSGGIIGSRLNIISPPGWKWRFNRNDSTKNSTKTYAFYSSQ